MIDPMYARLLRNAEHTRRFSILPSVRGWEVREEEDSHVTRQVHYSDWHRVERARWSFAREARLLEAAGWTDA